MPFELFSKENEESSNYCNNFIDQGWYIYIEASAPRRPNDTAIIFTPVINDTQTRCLSFWYHMYGTHVNTLLAYLKTTDVTGLGTVLWKKSGDQGNKWIQASVTVNPSKFYQVHGYINFVML